MWNVKSINGLNIRLSEERWRFIIYEHIELEDCLDMVLNTVADPDIIFAGNVDELLAVKKFSGVFYIVSVYKEKEESKDGFIITAYTLDNLSNIKKRDIIWKKQ